VIVAVFAVRMMEMSVHQVIGVIPMRHRLMTAVRPVSVCGFVRAAVVARGAVGRIRSAYRNCVVVDVAVVNMMQVSVMQIIGMAVVLDGGVAAILAVCMGVTLMFDARCGHNVLCEAERGLTAIMGAWLSTVKPCTCGQLPPKCRFNASSYVHFPFAPAGIPFAAGI
jgi:hypothetical protein